MKSINTEFPMYFEAKPDIFKKAKELGKTETQENTNAGDMVCCQVRSDYLSK